KASEFELNADELGALRPAVLLQPVGVDQPYPVVVGTGADGGQKPFLGCAHVGWLRSDSTSSNLQQSGAVAQPIRSHADAVQQGQKKVRDRGVLAVVDVPAGLQAAVSRADDEGGQVVVRVAVAVGDAGAVQDYAAVEQGRVAVLRGLEFGHELREQFHVVSLN